MNRLHTELHRLYLSAAAPAGSTPADDTTSVRAMVLELAAPADWEATSRLWQAVQADLELPAPALAVNGVDGYQLWFSLADPVPPAQAAAFVEGLRARHLGESRSRRITALPVRPVLPGSDAVAADRATLMPPREVADGIWAAFVAPDLAPMFADEPWIDMPPGEDGQSTLLARMKSMSGDDFRRALARLHRPAVDGTPAGGAARAGAARDDPAVAATDAPAVDRPRDPRAFLLDVMNDPGVVLALRIEAAKALLAHGAPQAVDPSRD